jgi:hypothetical protein
VGGVYIIEIALDDVNIRGYRAEKVVCFAIGDVSCADCLLDFPWDQEFLEFCGKGGRARRDVEVSYYEDEDHFRDGGVLFLWKRRPFERGWSILKSETIVRQLSNRRSTSQPPRNSYRQVRLY